MNAAQISKWVDDPDRFDWEAIGRVDPVGAAGCALSPAVPQLHEFAGRDDFRDIWPALNQPELLSSEMAPILAAIIAWRRAAPNPDDMVANLAALIDVLSAAAGQYDNTKGDMRGMRLMPMFFAARVAQASGEDVSSDNELLEGLASSLMEGFWALLGQRSGRWCAGYSITGPIWRPAPDDPQRRGSLLLAAMRAGLPTMVLSPRLAAHLPDEPDRYLRPDVAQLRDLCECAGLRPDPRMIARHHQGWQPQDLPRHQWQITFSDRGLQRLMFDTPESLGAPFSTQPLALPWLAVCDNGSFFGYCPLQEHDDLAMFRVAPDPAPSPAPLIRRAMRYANIPSGSMPGCWESMTAIISGCVHDLINPGVLAQHYTQMIDPQENDPSVPRARRRELRRQRERGHGSAWQLVDETDTDTWSAIRWMRA